MLCLSGIFIRVKKIPFYRIAHLKLTEDSAHDIFCGSGFILLRLTISFLLVLIVIGEESGQEAAMPDVL